MGLDYDIEVQELGFDVPPWIGAATFKNWRKSDG